VRSLRFLASRRWLLFLLAVIVLAYGTWWLGAWQFHRLHNTRQSNTYIRTNESMTPVPIDQVLAPGRPVASQDEWKRVTVTGTYDPKHTITWRYLTNDHSESGVDEVVPLVTADGTAVLVDRGWVASADPTSLPADPPQAPTGQVTVVGWVRQDGTGSATSVADLGTRALSSVTAGKAIGHPVYGGFLDLQTEDGSPAPGVTQVDMPELNDGPHFFYGIQWWFFGVLAIIGFIYLGYDEWRIRTNAASDDPEDAEKLAARLAESDERQQRVVAKNRQRSAVKAAYKAAYEREKQEKEKASRPS
jgi:cytochrome oxidase assembly protein ShyY1